MRAAADECLTPAGAPLEYAEVAVVGGVPTHVRACAGRAAARARELGKAVMDGETARVRVAFAPYRACPLGAHVDHQGGTVTGFALNEGVVVAFAHGPPTGEFEGVVHSEFAPDNPVTFRKGSPAWPDGGHGVSGWHRYVRGAAELTRTGWAQPAGKFVAVVCTTTDGLHGQGVSSSAALTAALAAAMLDNASGGKGPTADTLVNICRAVENKFCGLSCGILDMAVIVNARKDHVVKIDCRLHESGAPLSKAVTLVPCGGNTEALLVFSGVRSNLAAENGGPSPYNQRVDECRRAATHLMTLGKQDDSAHSLSDVSATRYEQGIGALAAEHPALARRAEHFFGEKDRVVKGVAALESGNLAEVGALVTQSGMSSIHKYECGCAPLRTLFDTLTKDPRVFGARYSGAGFRGAVLALCKPGEGDAAGRAALDVFRDKYPEYGSDATHIVCGLEHGLVVFDGEDAMPPVLEGRLETPPGLTGV